MNQKIENTNVGESLVYETSLLFVPELDSDALSQTISTIKEKLVSLEGEIVSEGEPVHIKLAYQVVKSIKNKLKKIDHAHFYWVKFEISPSKIAEFEKFLKEVMAVEVMRYLLVKTIRENTVLTKLTEAKSSKADEALIEEVISGETKADTEIAPLDEKEPITDLGDEAVVAPAEEVEQKIAE